MAQIADIVLVALLLFAVLSIAARTRYYNWFRLVAAIVIPPYLVQRTQSFFPFDLIEGIVIILLVVWSGVLLLLLLRFGRLVQAPDAFWQRDRRLAGLVCVEQLCPADLGGDVEACAERDQGCMGD